jgi:hypothetical protein
VESSNRGRKRERNKWRGRETKRKIGRRQRESAIETDREILRGRYRKFDRERARCLSPWASSALR